MITHIDDIPSHLFKSRLARRSAPDKDGNYVVKYTKRAFYKQAWKQHPILEELRGLVFDSDGQVISRPFHKLYNYGENGAGKNIPLDTDVQAVKKINGFLGVVRCHEGEVICSTTGTLDSEYADTVRRMVSFSGFDHHIWKRRSTDNHTFMFECVHPDDPHVVPEKHGIHLIGIRDIYSGELAPEQYVDEYYQSMMKSHDIVRDYIHRPSWYVCSLDDMLQFQKESKIEGWIIRDNLTGQPLFKLKTDYYTRKKFFMRVKKESNLLQVMRQLENEDYDEEIEMVLEKIRQNGTEWFLSLNDQERFSN